MNDWLFLIIAIFAILFGLMWWRLQYQSSRQSSLSSQKFHAVSIIPGERACSAVQKLQNKRYLSAEVEKLPLAECNAAKCTCKYQHYDDRRSGRDRRYPNIVTMEHVEVLQEHRSGLDRRRNWPQPLTSH